MHNLFVHLKICGKYLAKRGKVVKISGLNIVNLTNLTPTKHKGFIR